MASNREERLQMRQRGAGTRKIQALDFGFSFGSPPPGSQSNQGALEGTTTNNIDSVVAEAAPQAETLPNATPSINNDSTAKSPANTVRASNTPVRSPQSSTRTSINRVSSALNPTNDAQEEGGRSSKRRRISTENERSTPASASRQSTRVANTSPATTTADAPSNDSPQNGVTAEAAPELATATADGAGDNDGHVEQEAEPEPEPAQEFVKPHRRGRAKSITSPKEASNTKTSEADERPRSKPGRRRSAVNGTDPPVDNGEGPSLSNRKRRQPAKANDAEDEEESESGNAAPPRNKRRQKRKDTRQASEPEQESERENTESTQRASRGGRKSLGRPARNVEPEPEENEEDDTAAQARRRRKGKQKATETDVEETEAAPVGQSSKQGQTKKKQQQQPRESTAGPRRRGRPSLDKEQEEPQPEAETTTNNPPETTTEPAQPAKRRRRRQQRDETQEPEKRLHGTVSITVHRLANTEVLDSAQADADSSDHEQDSSDEQLEAAAAGGKQFPSRSGVNAADVLSQICKEILDKHITALTDNITNDTAGNNNQTKRAEYARQRKAVEAYGTQLEGRLFELSELLDSNFALGVQLKKAKREAAEMRNKLLAVRQQRHEVTLRMDAVRRKHGEEENAKMSRNAINNALHNLELTLDRNRRDGTGNEKDTGIAGLEFLLRSVSENVSSAAEGSQGGLLSQVKAFNAQLERAAKKLER